MSAIASDIEAKDITTEQDNDIAKLDFSLIKMKLQDSDEGLGWPESLCDSAEKEYRRFLALKRLYPDTEIVPNKIIDAFWHQHILDTEQYAKDCLTVFGYFLHHYPYFGMFGDSDYDNLCHAFEHTRELYEHHFSEPYAEDISMAKRCKAPRCRTQCKPQKCR